MNAETAGMNAKTAAEQADVARKLPNDEITQLIEQAEATLLPRTAYQGYLLDR